MRFFCESGVVQDLSYMILLTLLQWPRWNRRVGFPNSYGSETPDI